MRPKLSVNIYLDNAAFQDGNLSAEVNIILGSIVNHVINHEINGYCKDSNGNTVGQWAITYPKDKTDA